MGRVIQMVPGSIEHELRLRINSKVKLFAVGNSKRKLRDVAIDLINASELDWGDIAKGSFLSRGTIAKLAQDQTRWPQAETIERIIRFFNYQVVLSSVDIKGVYSNKPK